MRCKKFGIAVAGAAAGDAAAAAIGVGVPVVVGGVNSLNKLTF
jgi:hypothetical protein